MSSFKRKGSTKSPQTLPGTRLSPATPSTTITSTGIPSLDDILGGGLPLSCTLLILAPDHHSSYGELVQKYFIAQGLSSGQNIFVVDDNGTEFVRDAMWIPPSGQFQNEDEVDGITDEKIKIAWRYTRMKQFQTTVALSSEGDEFCRTFDLTNRVPKLVIDQALERGQLTYISVADGLDSVLHRIRDNLESQPNDSPVRVCVRSLGSPEWGDVGRQGILRFLYSLRSVLRRFPHACASLSLPPHLSTERWGGIGWVQKLCWLSDASLTLTAFSSNPSLSAAFSSYHGLVHIHRLPAPHSLLWPSDKYSTLRGLSLSAGSAVGSGENNLAFRCTRKRMVMETLHLDVEGGVSERRTKGGLAAVAVGIETEEAGVPGKRTSKKKVGFRSDRPATVVRE